MRKYSKKDLVGFSEGKRPIFDLTSRFELIPDFFSRLVT
jgi:hypothetical protein